MNKLTDYEQQQLPYRRKTDMIVVKGDQVLLLITNKKDGTIRHSLPGGKIDKGETPIEAGVRECQEETGVVCKNAELLNFKRVQDFEYNPEGSSTTRARYKKFRGTYSEFGKAEYSHLDFSIYDDEKRVSNGWFTYTQAVNKVMKHAQGPFIVDAFKLAGLIPQDFKALECDDGPRFGVRAARLKYRKCLDVIIKREDKVLLMKQDVDGKTEYSLPRSTGKSMAKTVKKKVGLVMVGSVGVGEGYRSEFEYAPYSSEAYMKAYYKYRGDEVNVALCRVREGDAGDNCEWFSNLDAHLHLRGGEYIRSLQMGSPITGKVSQEHQVLRSDELSDKEWLDLEWRETYSMVVLNKGKILVHKGALEDGRVNYSLPIGKMGFSGLETSTKVGMLRSCGILMNRVERLDVEQKFSYAFEQGFSDDDKERYYGFK